METYPKPNLTAEQIRSGAMRDETPLKVFSEICRGELESMQRQF
jgi:hypothetical protein